MNAFGNQKRVPASGVMTTTAIARTAKPVLAGAAALALAACSSQFREPEVAGWLLPDARQRHPIMLSRQPSTMSVSVPRGGYGLTPAQRANAIQFFRRYRSEDHGNSRVVMHVPKGGANDIAVEHAVGELRHIASDLGFAETSIELRAHQTGRHTSPPIRVSYTRYVAQGPDCGYWPKDLGNNSKNVTYSDFGCSDQKNLAVMVSNPADLDGPRTMTPRSSARRDIAWDKFKKGESTISTKSNDEKVNVKVSE